MILSCRRIYTYILFISCFTKTTSKYFLSLNMALKCRVTRKADVIRLINNGISSLSSSYLQSVLNKSSLFHGNPGSFYPTVKERGLFMLVSFNDVSAEGQPFFCFFHLRRILIIELFPSGRPRIINGCSISGIAPRLSISEQSLTSGPLTLDIGPLKEKRHSQRALLSFSCTHYSSHPNPPSLFTSVCIRKSGNFVHKSLLKYVLKPQHAACGRNKMPNNFFCFGVKSDYYVTFYANECSLGFQAFQALCKGMYNKMELLQLIRLMVRPSPVFSTADRVFVQKQRLNCHIPAGVLCETCNMPILSSERAYNSNCFG